MDTTIIYGGGIILGLVIWLALTFHATRMAAARGHSAVTWGVLTCLAFGIAMFVLAIMPSKKGTS